MIKPTLPLIRRNISDYWPETAYQTHPIYVRPRSLDTMDTHIQPGVCFMIPEELIGSMFFHLLRPFTSSLIVAILCIMIIIQAFSIVFNNLFPRGILSQVFYGSLIPGHEMHWIERFTLFFFAVLLFILSESYIAKLFQLMFQHQYRTHLESIEDLINKDLVIYTQSEFYSQHVYGLFPSLRNQLQVLTSFIDPLDHDTLLCTSCVFIENYVQSENNLDPITGALQYYVLSEKIPIVTEAFTHSRLQPFSQRFKIIYSRLLEAGFVDHWVMVFKEILLSVPENRLQIVEFKQLLSLWKLLVLGFATGSVAFFMEVVAYYGWLGLHKVHFRIFKFSVTQLRRLAQAPKRCDFYVILLDPVHDANHFNELGQSFLEADRWNRYGMFAFVSLEEMTPVLENLWMFYRHLVKTLGITNAVLVFEKNGGALPVVIQFNYFKDELIMLDDIYAAQEKLRADYLSDVNGAFKYYVLPEKIPIVTEAFTHSRLQPFSQRFNIINSKLLEAGFVDYWVIIYKDIFLSIPESRLQIVEFKQLISLWKLLVLGFSCGCVAFFVEVVAYYGWLGLLLPSLQWEHIS
ncbi:conserved hypothetical protein [Culex quinquefasciatus]|uniref:Uncharacterized protein n=1 Tax=Culex quinquefasciatus TaxID=7176 RepID=B0WE63_CULQU|nr:conserved hypothetical protein [Culex quinquefasciatus]|eukprot:XP_001846997.1 conserved hypothetical protein [Culex quinquefasciatus]